MFQFFNFHYVIFEFIFSNMIKNQQMNYTNFKEFAIH